MVNNNELKNKILKELTDFVTPKRAAIKELKETERSLRSANLGRGILAAAAENSFNNSANKARNEARTIESQIAWHEEILKKYR